MALLFIALAISTSSALAGTASGRQFLFSFDGSDTGVGAFTRVESLAVDQSTGAVYAFSEFEGKPGLAKFHPDGTAWNFTATGSPVLFGTQAHPFTNEFGKVDVNNSGGAEQGSLVVASGERLYAFAESGAPLWDRALGFSEAFDVTLDDAGHPWVIGNNEADEFANTGSPPEQIANVPTEFAFNIDFDASGNGYLGTGSQVKRYPGGDFLAEPTLLDENGEGVYADRSTAAGHIFTSAKTLDEYDAGGALVSSFGQEYLQGETRWAVAYDHTLDRVYVSQLGETFNHGGVVAVFGPPVPEGVVPDATIEAADGVGISHATLHGTVNPQGVSSSYHFEWKVDEPEVSWASAYSSPSISLPEDSSDHAVEYQATGLKGGQAYQFRLVTTNTTNGLHGFSAREDLTTHVASEPPAVTIESAAPTGPTTAHVAGTIDPQEDATSWTTQLTTDPNCAEGFSDGPTHNIPSEEPGTVPVAEDLTGLLPAEHYCVRLQATNSAGATTSEVAEFTTGTVVPTESDTAFAAPRTDTTARLNGFVNPEGAPVVYSFEYSDDGGATWTALPAQHYEAESRVQQVVSYELTGLAPATTYQYRFNVESAAGPAVQGATRTFETRTSAEVADPGRGIEMVSAADKGNQNATVPGSAFINTISPDGSAAMWEVPGGAPGGNSSSYNTFIARRTPTGWQSAPVAPPAAEQYGEGNLAYSVFATTPDLTKAVVYAARRLPQFGPERLGEVLAVDQAYDQLPLVHLTEGQQGAMFSTDLSHVVMLLGDSNQLEDIGDGSPEVVSIMPDGTESECGPTINLFPERGYRAMSEDGSLIYFSAQPNGQCGSSAPSGIYLRKVGQSETVAVDPGVDGAPQSPEIIRATPNGRELYFTTYSSLAADDENSTNDVYRWDEESEEAHCLTCVVPSAEVGAEGGSQVLVSDDFSSIYFDSAKRLVPNRGQAGRSNVYLLRNGSIRYVSTFYTPLGGNARSLLSSDGNTLLMFAKAAPMTTSDAVGSCSAFAGVNDPCEQQYLYEAGAEAITCISCRAEGSTDSRASTEIFTESFLSLSPDGSTAAFVTPAALLPSDVNRESDVYEWRNGIVRLITDGLSERGNNQAEPHVDGISDGGNDILFSVAQEGLTGFEQDGLAAVYDARIGGGFEPEVPPAHCDEESCQGPLIGAPSFAQPGSASFNGAGNLPKKKSCARHHHSKRRCHRRHRHHHAGKHRHHRGRSGKSQAAGGQK